MKYSYCKFKYIYFYIQNINNKLKKLNTFLKTPFFLPLTEKNSKYKKEKLINDNRLFILNNKIKSNNQLQFI